VELAFMRHKADGAELLDRPPADFDAKDDAVVGEQAFVLGSKGTAA
jgi:hypothetical protein